MNFLNPVQALETEALKQIKSHPQVKQALEVLDKFLVTAAGILVKFSPAEIQSALTAANVATGAKFSAAEVAAAATALASLPGTLLQLDALVKQAENAVG